ncbi:MULTISPECIES: DUF6461 domain-containing protein [Actinomycetes]|uniref:Uncharacterized protein n=1 Tax=Gordonia malaquae NBRC 108250 TaxID=1223542 RepID=M3V0K9_GORML|nr:hypothetical protein GM1_059_00050 [Gordonia malaquae NBRC 108250]
MPELNNAFCVTVISNATLPERIDALPTVSQPAQCDLATLLLRSLESWEEIGSDNLLAGLVQHCDWTIMYESNGYIGATPELMQPLSAGRKSLFITAARTRTSFGRSTARAEHGSTRYSPLSGTARHPMSSCR